MLTIFGCWDLTTVCTTTHHHHTQVVFLKASWHVGEPFVKHYTEWEMDKAYGKLTTRGHFDEAMYRWAIQLEAQVGPWVAKCE